MNEHLVPTTLRGMVSACCMNMRDCEQLIKYWGMGPNYTPQKPVLLIYPVNNSGTGPGQVVAFIAAEGVTPAAELQDLAVSAFGRALEKIKKHNGQLFDSDEMREKHGAVPKAAFDAEFRNALEDRVALHKANPITDPPRQPYHADTGKRTFGG